MEYNTDKIDEITLALLSLNFFDEIEDGSVRAWKSFDWDTMDRLYEKGHISDPKNKAKSVVLSKEGKKRAEELFEKHFL